MLWLVIEVDDTVFTQSASHAERIKEFISNHYGHIGRHFTNSFLNKNEDEVTKLFKQSLIEVREKLVKKTVFLTDYPIKLQF